MSLPSKFRKCFLYNSEDKAVSRFFFDAHFDRECLKFVSAIFYQIFIFSPNDSHSKTVKNVFSFMFFQIGKFL